jgi:multiple sugar transport system ATP-binding protein
MDEPLSNLDALLRLHMRAELKRLHREVGSTTVYVTHDQLEALSLGDRIAVMKSGEIVQYGTATEIYDRPANRFVGSFIGAPPMNFLSGRLRGTDGSLALDTAGGTVALPHALRASLGSRTAGEIVVGIRPEHIEMAVTPAAGAIAAETLVVEPVGAYQLVTVRAGKEILKVTVPTDLEVHPAQRVWLRMNPGRIRLMDAQTGEAVGAAS